MSEEGPPPTINESDLRGWIAIIVLAGYLVASMAAPLWLENTFLADMISTFSPLVTLVLGFYFGVKSAKTEPINVQHLLTAMLENQTKLVDIQTKNQTLESIKERIEEANQDG
jgi:hypothetical protein